MTYLGIDMKVMVRINEPTSKQEKFFGNFAWRPFLFIRDVSDEDELKQIIINTINGKKQKGVIKFCEYEGGDLQYAVLPIREWIPIRL